MRSTFCDAMEQYHVRTNVAIQRHCLSISQLSALTQTPTTTHTHTHKHMQHMHGLMICTKANYNSLNLFNFTQAVTNVLFSHYLCDYVIFRSSTLAAQSMTKRQAINSSYIETLLNIISKGSQSIYNHACACLLLQRYSGAWNGY